MAVVKMMRISAAGLKSKQEQFLKELMALGFVEIDTNCATTETEGFSSEKIIDEVSSYDKKIAEAADSIKNLSKYADLKSPLISMRKEISEEEFEASINEEAVLESIEAINNAANEIAMAETDINHLKALVAGLKPWEDLRVDFNMEGTKNTSFLLGTLPVKTDFSSVLKELSESLPSVIINSVSEDKQFRYVYAFYFKYDKDELLSILRKYNFNALTKGNEKGTAQEIIEKFEKQIEKDKADIENRKSIISAHSGEKESIERYFDQSVMNKDRLKVVSDMMTTKNVFYFEGWVPEKCKDDIKNLFDKYGYYFEMREAEDDEEPPVLLQNSNIVTPFEAVTSMYSLPSKGDIDPTKFLAPFYFIFFGLMLSDAAYGIILSVGCFLMLKKFKPEGTMYKMLKMFFYCGISTFFWGVLFGGWFGDIVTIVSKTFLGREISIAPLWFAPMEEPMTLLIFSLILGAIHLFTGMAIQAYVLVKDGKPLDALFDIGLWYVLLIGLVLFGAGGMAAPALSTIGMYMSIVGAVGILLTGGRHKKGIFGKITGGLGSLYGITSYLSDVLSYSRLLALGLATGVVASVVNMLGSLMGGGIVGAIVLIVVFVIGHIFNLAINALGAFVHSCRLQYVEFFGKFYTGGGRPFKPFMRNTKYVKIVEEENKNG